MELIGLTKNFDRKIFENINLTLEKGKAYVLKGISGCGKTTLLNIIGGLDEDYEGQCNYQGIDIKNFTQNEKNSYRDRVAYVNQQSLLIANMTVKENLLFVSGDEVLINDYAGQFGVEHLFDKYPEQLSGGERQRISIIRALIKIPDIFIADEPTASLGEKHSKQIAECIEFVKQMGVIVVIATHENVFDNMADVIVNMKTDGTYTIDHKNDNKTVLCKNEQREFVKGKKDVVFSFKQLKKVKNIMMEVILIILEIVLLSAIGVMSNYRREYVREISETYKSYIMLTTQYESRFLVEKYGEDEVEILDFYMLEENGFKVYSMLEEDDCGFAIKGSLECGVFPKDSNQILINCEMADDMVGRGSHENAIGKSVTIAGNKYTVSGVIVGEETADSNEKYLDAYGKIDAYKPVGYGAKAFVIKDTIEDIGTLADSIGVNIRFKNFYKYPEILNSIVDSEVEQFIECPGEARIINGLYQIEVINTVIIIVAIAAGFVMIIFVQNQIVMNMHYRRREIGYFQIFGIGKKRIVRLLVIENCLKAGISIVLCNLVYYMTFMMVKAITGYNLINSICIVAVFNLIVSVYCVVSAYVPLKKVLRENIISLIR